MKKKNITRKQKIKMSSLVIQNVIFVRSDDALLEEEEGKMVQALL